ncbi:hypothetical protein [Salinicoccus sp. CNSTN-B1]
MAEEKKGLFDKAKDLVDKAKDKDTRENVSNKWDDAKEFGDQHADKVGAGDKWDTVSEKGDSIVDKYGVDGDEENKDDEEK